MKWLKIDLSEGVAYLMTFFAVGCGLVVARTSGWISGFDDSKAFERCAATAILHDEKSTLSDEARNILDQFLND